MKLSKTQVNNAVRNLLAQVPTRLLTAPGFSKAYCIQRSIEASNSNDPDNALKFLLLAKGLVDGPTKSKRKARSQTPAGNEPVPSQDGVVHQGDPR